jgi:hypothetical protein
MPSKVFGPTDSVADTLTQIGANYQMLPKDCTIYAIRIGCGNVVNAKSYSGHVHITTVDRSYDFAFGNGSGGATNTSNTPAEMINAAIFVPANSNVAVYVLQGDACKDVTVSLQFREGAVGNCRNFRTLAAGGVSANADTAADTEESFSCSAKLTGCSLQPAVNGRIYQIRYAGTGVVDAKANTAKIVLNIPSEAGPYEYAVGCGPGGATLGAPEKADVIDIPEGIPVKAQGTIIINITSAEIIKSPVISLSYW